MSDEERKEENKDVAQAGSVTLLADDVTAIIDRAERLAQAMEFCLTRAKGILLSPKIGYCQPDGGHVVNVALAIFNRATAHEPMERYIERLADILGKKDSAGGPPIVSAGPMFTSNPTDRLANLMLDRIEEQGVDLLLLGKGVKSS